MGARVVAGRAPSRYKVHYRVKMRLRCVTNELGKGGHVHRRHTRTKRRVVQQGEGS